MKPCACLHSAAAHDNHHQQIEESHCHLLFFGYCYETECCLLHVQVKKQAMLLINSYVELLLPGAGGMEAIHR
jgi:hypothetical protein